MFVDYLQLMSSIVLFLCHRFEGMMHKHTGHSYILFLYYLTRAYPYHVCQIYSCFKIIILHK